MKTIDDIKNCKDEMDNEIHGAISDFIEKTGLYPDVEVAVESPYSIMAASELPGCGGMSGPAMKFGGKVEINSKVEL